MRMTAMWSNAMAPIRIGVAVIAAALFAACTVAGFAQAQDPKNKTPDLVIKPLPYKMSAQQLLCQQAKYPDCPSGCVKDEKSKSCFAPMPGGTMVQMPGLTNICEGAVWPDCPDWCDSDAQSKKCTPKAIAVDPRPRQPGG